jgi:hypothetical protein
MTVRRIPASVRAQLGDEATFGLIELLDSEEKSWSDRMLTMTADRFERRLTEQVSLLRQDLHQSINDVRSDLANARVEMLRWSFVFWIGQVAAVAALLAFMLRATGR